MPMNAVLTGRVDWILRSRMGLLMSNNFRAEQTIQCKYQDMLVIVVLGQRD